MLGVSVLDVPAAAVFFEFMLNEGKIVAVVGIPERLDVLFDKIVVVVLLEEDFVAVLGKVVVSVGPETVQVESGAGSVVVAFVECTNGASPFKGHYVSGVTIVFTHSLCKMLVEEKRRRLGGLFYLL